VNYIPAVTDTNIIRYADLFRLIMPDGTYYFATTPTPITIPSISSTPFTALGQLVKVGNIQRDIKSTANETTVTLVGIDTAMLGLVLNSKIKGSQIDLWHAFFDSDGNLITSNSNYWTNNIGNTIPWTNNVGSTIPWLSSVATTGVYKYFSGYVNSFTISEQWAEETRSYVGVVSISAANFQLVLQNRTAGRYTNDNAWQSANSGDTSMNRVAFITNINYAFGRTPPPVDIRQQISDGVTNAFNNIVDR
jgi:hypothetical protein